MPISSRNAIVLRADIMRPGPAFDSELQIDEPARVLENFQSICSLVAQRNWMKERRSSDFCARIYPVSSKV